MRRSVEPIEAGSATCPASGCPDAGDGPDGAQLQLEVNNCPRVALDVTPVRALLDQPVRVSSRSEDADGDALSYEWLAEPDGDYADPSEPATDYLCESLGRKTLQLLATDEHGCEASAEVEVSCVPAAP